MILQGGDRLKPENLSGRTANLGRPHPLVFLTACQIGQSGIAFTGMGGWAIRFLKAGAAGFLVILVGLRRAGPELRQILLRPAPGR